MLRSSRYGYVGSAKSLLALAALGAILQAVTIGWRDIGYSFLVGGDGRVYEGRGWGQVGAHTRGYNHNGIAISFVGDFTKSTPNQGMLNAAKNLIACGVKIGKINPSYSLHGHRDANCTACPGNRLYDIIKKWARYGGRLKKFVC